MKLVRKELLRHQLLPDLAAAEPAAEAAEDAAPAAPDPDPDPAPEPVDAGLAAGECEVWSTMSSTRN